MAEDMAIVTRILLFLTCLTFIDLLLPEAVRFVSIGSLFVFASTVTGVAAFCTVTTGIPCVVALGLGALLNTLGSLLAALGISSVPVLSDLVLTSTQSWVTTLILAPISIILTIFLARLGRGVK